MKPSGLCTKCKWVNKCEVDTHTMAKVIQCVYKADFEKNDKKVRSSKNR